MSSNLPPGCGQLPGEVDDGVTILQETVLEFLEDQTPLPEIVNDQIMMLVAFYEDNNIPECAQQGREYKLALANRLEQMARKIRNQP